jgi:hypothetical protein
LPARVWLSADFAHPSTKDIIDPLKMRLTLSYLQKHIPAMGNV